MVAALIFSVAALLVKLTGGRVPVLEITLLRSGISLVVSAGGIVISGWWGALCVDMQAGQRGLGARHTCEVLGCSRVQGCAIAEAVHH